MPASSRAVFVGRLDPLERVRAFLTTRPSPRPRLRILSIGGPGGIGKTYLVDHALDTLDEAQREHLVARASGAERARLGDIVAESFLRGLSPPDVLPRAFPKLQACARELREVHDQADRAARAEAEKLLRKSLPDHKELLHDLFVLAKSAAEVSKHLRAYADLGKVNPEAIRAAQNILNHASEGPDEWAVPGLWPWSGRHLRNRLRANTPRVLATALIEDLQAFFLEDAGARRLASRFLWILDDYEQSGPLLQDFLTHHLLPGLLHADFQVDLVVIGRDILSVTNPVWLQRFGSLLEDEVQLAAFDDEVARAFCREHGLTDPDAIERIVRETQGYPFLLASEVQDEVGGGRGALALKGFVDRTTRWMTPTQRTWFERLCFVDRVDEEVVARVLPDANPAEVMAWFMTEASVRDAHAEVWRVRPLIASRVQRFVETVAPGRARAWREAP